MPPKDYYKILGVKESSPEEDIKKAYRQLAHQYHPDKAGGDEKRFKEINEAYQILSDKDKRSQYDMMRKYGAGGFSQYGNVNWGEAAGFSPFGFGTGAGLEDILREFFGGGFAQAGTRQGFGGFGGFSRPRQTVQFSFQGPRGTHLVVEVTSDKGVSQKMKRKIDDFAQDFFGSID